MCAFMPKYHWLPFFVWCISGSRSPLAFLVELGAAISVASTTVPARSIKPLLRSVSLIEASICAASLCLSNRWRNRRIVLSSGRRVVQLSSPANSRHSGTSCNASSIVGLLSPNYCCMT
jgi:hypothetical protein